MSNEATQNLLTVIGLVVGAAAGWWAATAEWFATLGPPAAGADPIMVGAMGAIVGVLAGWGASHLLRRSSPAPSPQATSAGTAAQKPAPRTPAAPRPDTPDTPPEMEAATAPETDDAHSDEDYAKTPPPEDADLPAHPALFDDLPALEEHSDGDSYKPSLNSIVVALSDVEPPDRDQADGAPINAMRETENVNEAATSSLDSAATSSTTLSDADSDVESVSFNALASAMGGSDGEDAAPESSQEGEFSVPARPPRSEASRDVESMANRPLDEVAAISPFGGNQEPDSEPGELNLEVDPSISSIDDLASSFGSDAPEAPKDEHRSSQGIFNTDINPESSDLSEQTASYSETTTMAVPGPSSGSARSAREQTEESVKSARNGRLRVPSKSLVASRMGIIGESERRAGGAAGPGDRLGKSKAFSDPTTQTRRVNRGKLDRIRRSSVADSETEIQRLYSQFLDQIGGRQAANSVMDYQNFQKLVRENRRQVREKYGVDAVDMTVEIESGRPKITIRPAG